MVIQLAKYMELELKPNHFSNCEQFEIWKKSLIKYMSQVKKERERGRLLREEAGQGGL